MWGKKISIPSGEGKSADSDREDPVLREVIDLNKQYTNTRYSKSSPMRVGPGDMFAVSYLGQDKKWYTNYVFRRRGKCRAYETFDKLIADPRNQINIPWYAEFETVRFFLIFLLAIILIVVWICVYSQHGDNKDGLQYLTGLLGILIGWLVAKTPKASEAED